MSIEELLSKIQAFAARTPTGEHDIDEILGHIVDITKRQFNAKLVDIMWESKQGHRTELQLVKAYDPQNTYTARPIYHARKAPGRPDSLTGWSYERDQPVWIVDPKGLRRSKGYVNEWPDPRDHSRIPAGTIYEYMNPRMGTEICHPLRTYVHKSQRAAGVLNIELKEPIHPSPIAKKFISIVASVVEQLQNRKFASQTAEGYAREAIRKLSELKAELEEYEPGLKPKAFVAMPMSISSAGNLKRWINDALESQGIGCLWPETNGDITEAIWRNIRTAHFGVVISTGFNRNVMCEWGYLLGCRKPVIRLHSTNGDNEHDPFDVATMRSLPLNRPGEEISEAHVKKILNDALKQLIRDNRRLAEHLHLHAYAKEASRK